jgi:adenylate cyclase
LTWLGAIGLGWILLGAALAAQLAIGLRLFSLAAVSLLTGVVSSGEATVRLQWQRRRLRQSLERYLSPAVAAQIADQSTADAELLGGQQAEVVVLLTDLRGFTRYTHQMSRRGQAVEVVDRLNAYFTELVSAIHAHGGTVDKFIGDSCLAVFGAPLHRGNGQEANAALDAAEEIQQRLQTLNTNWSRQGIEPWQQVIAISFGSVISGNIGSPSRMDYTVIGDAVNSASRLEAIAKANGYPLVITEAVAQLLNGSRPLRDLGLQELRGQEPLRVFAVESVHDDSSTQEKPLEDS